MVPPIYAVFWWSVVTSKCSGVIRTTLLLKRRHVSVNYLLMKSQDLHLDLHTNQERNGARHKKKPWSKGLKSILLSPTPSFYNVFPKARKLFLLIPDVLIYFHVMMMHERYGKGNWKDIKIAYPDVFIDRSTVCTRFCVHYMFICHGHLRSVDLRKPKTMVPGRYEGQVQKHGEVPYHLVWSVHGEPCQKQIFLAPAGVYIRRHESPSCKGHEISWPFGCCKLQQSGVRALPSAFPCTGRCGLYLVARLMMLFVSDCFVMMIPSLSLCSSSLVVADAKSFLEVRQTSASVGWVSVGVCGGLEPPIYLSGL